MMAVSKAVSRRRFRLIEAVAFLALAALLGACSRTKKATRQWYAMDTDFSTTLFQTGRLGGSGAGVTMDSAFASLEAESRRLELIFSDFLPYSALSALKGKAGDTVPIPAPELAEVLRAAEAVARSTGGTLDVTLHRLKRAWGLASGDSGRVPDSAAIADAMRGNPAFGAPPWGHPEAHPPFRVLDDGRLVILRDSAAFDLGGIAKGYAVDRLHERLDSLGYPVHLVQAGGDMRVSGMKQEGPWRIGIRHPRRPDSLAGHLRLDSPLAVSTSGDYERYFIAGGVRYHHIFDPRTGRPAGPWCSVTVLAPSSLQADALTEPMFVMGPERGLTLLSGMGAEALWLREAGQGFCHVASPGLAGRFTLEGVPWDPLESTCRHASLSIL